MNKAAFSYVLDITWIIYYARIISAKGDLKKVPKF